MPEIDEELESSLDPQGLIDDAFEGGTDYQEEDLPSALQDYLSPQENSASGRQPGQPGKFDDATPDSVKLQPETPPAEPDVIGGGVDKRVTSAEKQGLAPDAQPLPGDKKLYDPKPNPNNGGASVAKKNPSTPEVKGPKPSGGTAAGGGRGGNLKSAAFEKGAQVVLGDGAVGKTAAAGIKVANTAKTIGMIIEGIIAAPEILIALLIVLAVIVIALIIGIVIALVMSPRGDVPPKTFTVGVPGQVQGNWANPDGIYLDVMTESILIEGKSLFVETTSGGAGTERTVYRGKNGKLCLFPDSAGNCFYMEKDPDGGHNIIASSSKYDPKLKRKVPYTDDEIAHIVNMRFPYVHDVNWNGTTKRGLGPTMTGMAKGEYYHGRRLIFYNPATQKAVVGIAAEWGPAPWAGVCSGSSSDADNPRIKAPMASCIEQKAAWMSPSRRGAKGDFRPPANYTGRIMGAVPKVMNEVGLKTDDPVIVGFAKNQDLPLGPLDVTSDNIYDISTYISDPTNSSSLKVPGVQEGFGSGAAYSGAGDCGDASAAMVALYYLTDRGTKPKPAYNTLPQTLKNVLTPPDKEEKTLDKDAWFATKLGSCSTSEGVKAGSNNKAPSNWGFTNLSDFPEKDRKQKVFASLIKSFDAGDPVIIFARRDADRGAPYKGFQHVMVLTGYDKDTGQFYWNNPSRGGVEVRKVRSQHASMRGKSHMDWPTLYSLLGGQGTDTYCQPGDGFNYSKCEEGIKNPELDPNRKIFSMNRDHIVR